MSMFKCSGALFNGTIVINTTANATVTATTSGTTRTFTAVANASGVASIRVKKRGTYSITSTGTTRVGHATVSDATPVTAYYVWGKYNSDYKYTQESAYKSQYATYYVKAHVYVYSPNRTYGNYIQILSSTSPSLDADTGLYSYTHNGNLGYGDLNSTASGYNTFGRTGSYYAVQTETTGNGSNSSPWYFKATEWLTEFVLNSGAFYIRPDTYSGAATGGGYLYTSVGNYYKGTYVSEATATSLDAYPTDARYATDGYWYVAS